MRGLVPEGPVRNARYCLPRISDRPFTKTAQSESCRPTGARVTSLQASLDELSSEKVDLEAGFVNKACHPTSDLQATSKPCFVADEVVGGIGLGLHRSGALYIARAKDYQIEFRVGNSVASGREKLQLDSL